MRSLLAAIAICAVAFPATAQTVAPPFGADKALNDQQLLYIYRNKLKPLREEILARKEHEGGALSEASRAEFQARLNAINEDFRRFVKKQDIFGYNAWGDLDG